jgi:hypothetical protein
LLRAFGRRIASIHFRTGPMSPLRASVVTFDRSRAAVGYYFGFYGFRYAG